MVVSAIVLSTLLIVLCLYGIVHACKMAGNGPPGPPSMFALGDWNGAVKTIDAFTDRALKVYTALDPEKRLWAGKDGIEEAEPTVEISVWAFQKGQCPSPAVFIRFRPVNEEPPSNRLAIFPFEVLNWNLADGEFLNSNLELSERKRASMVGDCGEIHWLIWKPMGHEGKEGAK